MLDLSAGGCRMESPVTVEPGVSFELRIYAPDIEWPLMIEGANVQWVNGQTFGLAFFRITESSAPDALHFNRRFYAMMPIEEAIIETLRSSGPCCLDDIVTYLPNLSWGEIVLAVDRMSRDGRVLLRQLGYSTYQMALRSPVCVIQCTIEPEGAAVTGTRVSKTTQAA